MNIKKEVGRKAFHLSWGLVLIAYLNLEKTLGSKALVLPFGLFIGFLVIDYFRIQYGMKIPFFSRLLHDREEEGFFTPTTTMMGITIALAMLDKTIATAAIAMMVLGDIAANIIGRIAGKTFIGLKTIEGAAAGLTVNIILGLLIIGNLPIALVMGSVAAATELYTTKLDDNMLIILFSGTAGQLTLSLL